MTHAEDNRKRSKREANRRWREANKERIREYNRKYAESHPWKPSKAVYAKRELIIKAKDKPCVDCGAQLEQRRMHFDHVRGTKLFQVGLDAANRSQEAIEAEISKCEVRPSPSPGDR